MSKKEQSNCYNIVDCMGRSTEHYIYASNITEAKRKFKENSELWKKYGYYGGIKRVYNGGVRGSGWIK